MGAQEGPISGYRAETSTAFAPICDVHRPTPGRRKVHFKFPCLLGFPWRGAAKFWPPGDGVWGGDFNQALSGPERVGSDVGRQALLNAFKELGPRAITGEAARQDPLQRSTDHIAIPEEWSYGP